MKPITATKEVIVGYEAIDGTRFDSEAECKQYEQNARAVIAAQWHEIAPKRDHSESFYLSDDDCMRLIDLNSVERLTIANMYAKSRGGGTPFSEKMIGSTVAVLTGCDDDEIYGIYTRQEMIDWFMKVVNQIFGPEDSTEE